MTTRAKYNVGVQTFYEDTGYETVQPMAPLFFRDDFVGPGKLVIPAAASDESGMDWSKKIVGAGPPTVAGVANAVGGQVALTLEASSQKQDAVLYWDDQKALDTTKGLVFEARFQLSVLPSVAAVQAVIGVASDWVDGPNSNTCYAVVGATGSGALLLRSYDGVTTVSAALSPALTLITTDWAIVRIDFSDVTNVGIYVNGVQRTTAGQINWAATSTLAVLQPYMACYKASGTGVGTLKIDYVKAWMNRA